MRNARELDDSFEAARAGYSADRVVADPVLNRSYIAECRSRGLTASAEMLNRSLLNARKTGATSWGKTKHHTSFRDESEYAFASEIAIRFLERRDGITLDQVICSPDAAEEFDTIAARICPGFTSLQYRWAALNLRKKRRLKPEVLAHACRPVDVINSPASDLNLASVASQQGLYIFFCRNRTLYVGESSNLRRRLAKHLEHSDNKGLARWLWEHGADELNVEIQVLPANMLTRVRRAMEAELIRSRTPEFNVQMAD
ncbi:MAG: GIY-YIG nuclease family protein [Planctomycetes bacterium]|nr:GIY-YIG nuclease family protein [Planctomycetota bacterium]